MEIHLTLRNTCHGLCFVSEINTLSECHSSFLHNQTFYDVREYIAEYCLTTSEAVHLCITQHSVMCLNPK